jgi:hypothetical protein
MTELGVGGDGLFSWSAIVGTLAALHLLYNFVNKTKSLFYITIAEAT